MYQGSSSNRSLWFSVASLIWVVHLAGGLGSGATLEVGPGRPFAAIEEAYDRATAGDTILVHALPDDRPYEQTAVFVTKANLTFRAVPSEPSRRVRVDGKRFHYSGRGSVPRAIFQFNRGADDCVLAGFELSGAHNVSHNGAAVRINQANGIRIVDCDIHHNDMGIMSNGDGTQTSAVGQSITKCTIHHNGDYSHPGYNHNLYLGGTSVTLRFCEVHSSLTGHNVKSRAHQTRVEYCYVHDSANRELDLVDGTDTQPSDSDAIVLGCVITKNPKTRGNRTVIHFGQDGGRAHDGTLFLAFNTIVTPFLSPVVDLSEQRTRASLVGNLICDGGIRQNQQQLVVARNGANAANVTGHHNWLCGGFRPDPKTQLDLSSNTHLRVSEMLFSAADQHNYRLRREFEQAVVPSQLIEQLSLPTPPESNRSPQEAPLAWEYLHPASGHARDNSRPVAGAMGLR